jgi:DNA-binding transcriptional regulator YiaG
MGLIETARRRQLPPPAECKAIRQRAHIRADELAAEVRVHPVTLSLWESGKMRPTGRNAERWARALDDLRSVAAG